MQITIRKLDEKTTCKDYLQVQKRYLNRRETLKIKGWIIECTYENN